MISIMLPIYNELLNTLNSNNINQEENNFILDFKKLLLNKTLNSFNKNYNKIRPVLEEAVFFDPRFKRFPWMSHRDSSSITQSIVKKMIDKYKVK